MKIKWLFTLAIALSGTAHATEGTFDSNGVKIRYVTEGEGEAVVLIHGWMSDSSMWGGDGAGNTKLSPLAGFKLIAFDCRGHGKSDKPHEEDKYGVEMAEDVVRLMDHLKVKKAHLIGYSMGSYIAGYVAANHPDRVRSVIYGADGPLIKGAEGSGSKEVEIFSKAVDDGKGLGPYILYVSPPTRPKPTLEQANAIAKFIYNGKDVKAFAAAGMSLGALQVNADDLKKCKAPTLFIYGGNESHFVTDSITTARKVIPDSELKVIDGADHMTTLTKPDFGVTIVDFLRKNKSK